MRWPSFFEKRERPCSGCYCRDRGAGVRGRLGYVDHLLVSLHHGSDVPLQQPIPFIHKHYATDDGIDCRYCHTSAEKSSFAGNFTKANLATTSPIFNPAFCSSATLPVNFTATKKVLSAGVAILPAEGFLSKHSFSPAASATRYPVRPQLRELGVKSARSQQLQAVLRTPGGTAVIVFGILKMRLQEKFA